MPARCRRAGARARPACRLGPRTNSRHCGPSVRPHLGRVAGQLLQHLTRQLQHRAACVRLPARVGRVLLQARDRLRAHTRTSRALRADPACILPGTKSGSCWAEKDCPYRDQG